MAVMEPATMNDVTKSHITFSLPRRLLSPPAAAYLQTNSPMPIIPSLPLTPPPSLPSLHHVARDHTPLQSFISGWWILLITLLTALPWAIVAVWDAIDGDYRPRSEVAVRLLVSSVCLIIAYAAGILFCVVLTLAILNEDEDERHDEVATVLVLLVFNIWHVLRNVLGWTQFFAIRKIAHVFVKVQQNFGESFAGTNAKICKQGLLRLRVSERLFDNEWRRDIAYLSPWFRYGHAGNDNASQEAWAVATWRAWWTQDVDVLGRVPDLMPDGYKVSLEYRRPNVETLLSTDPPDVKDGVYENGRRIEGKLDWATALTRYGGEEGQQDTHGEPLRKVIDVSSATGVAVLVHEKITRVPNRMSALWYSTARFEELYSSKVLDMSKDDRFRDILFPSWAGWLRIAQDIGTHLERPVYLSNTHLENFAGELASASVILVKYPLKYRQLVQQVWLDGRNARWTFGWSGLLACFSHLWTYERVYVAMLNGLSLLALSTKTEVKHIDENVRSMLYGYAAFEVSDRAVGKSIANDRKAELLKRYSQNRGKTCRGSGLCATRLACKVLGLPAEASHMDGLPAFSTGWCSEYMERMPGNQKPQYGDSHDDVEAREGSSNVWRYPHSHT